MSGAALSNPSRTTFLAKAVLDLEACRTELTTYQYERVKCEGLVNDLEAVINAARQSQDDRALYEAYQNTYAGFQEFLFKFKFKRIFKETVEQLRRGDLIRLSGRPSAEVDQTRGRDQKQEEVKGSASPAIPVAEPEKKVNEIPVNPPVLQEEKKGSFVVNPAPSDLQRAHDSLLSTNRELQNDLKTAEDLFDRANGRIKEVHHQKIGLKKTLGEQKTKIADLEKENVKKDNEIIRLNGELAREKAKSAPLFRLNPPAGPAPEAKERKQPHPTSSPHGKPPQKPTSSSQGSFQWSSYSRSH